MVTLPFRTLRPEARAIVPPTSNTIVRGPESRVESVAKRAGTGIVQIGDVIDVAAASTGHQPSLPLAPGKASTSPGGRRAASSKRRRPAGSRTPACRSRFECPGCRHRVALGGQVRSESFCPARSAPASQHGLGRLSLGIRLPCGQAERQKRAVRECQGDLIGDNHWCLAPESVDRRTLRVGRCGGHTREGERRFWDVRLTHFTSGCHSMSEWPVNILVVKFLGRGWPGRALQTRSRSPSNS